MSSAVVDIAPEDYENDPILKVLYNANLTQDDIDALSEGFDSMDRDDVMTAYRILNKLTHYMSETESWSFGVLAAYDFQTPARHFDIDIAVVVGMKSENLLREISSWGIEKLKNKVNQLPVLYSDSATVLTTLVLRIISLYSDLEFKLQLALSRSTLVKIHSELEGLLTTFESHDDVKDRREDPPLVKKYRSFVTQLITELETTPFEDVQQEMFQVVRDLHEMFLKFSSQHYGQKQHKQRNIMDNFLSMEYDYEDEEHSNIPFSANHQQQFSSDGFRDEFLGSPSPNSRESVYTADTSPMSTSYMYGGKSTNNNNTHKRTMSGSSSAFSLASGNTNKSSITEELPSMLHAFEVARREEQEHKTGIPSTKKSTTSSRSSLGGGRIPKSLSYNQQYYHHTPIDYSQQHQHNELVHHPTKVATATTPRVPESASEQNVQVKMVGDRMMVKVGSSYMDMQDWLNKKNHSNPTENRQQSTMSMLRNAWGGKSNSQTPKSIDQMVDNSNNNNMKNSTSFPINKNPMTQQTPGDMNANQATTNPKHDWKGLENQFEQNYVASMDNF